MANNDDGLKKKKSKGKVLGIAGVGGSGLLTVVNGVLCYFDKGITPAQIFKFLNSWPVVILGIVVSITVILVERHWQDSITKRNEDDNKIDEKKINEYEAKIKDLENKLNETKEENTKLSIKSANDDVKIQYLEEEIERLKQNNREGVRGTDRRFFTGGRSGA